VSDVAVFATISEMFDAMWRGRIQPGDQVGCSHCPWMGVTTKFAPHLLACPDQSATS
jgi:hypothetical protein